MEKESGFFIQLKKQTVPDTKYNIKYKEINNLFIK